MPRDLADVLHHFLPESGPTRSRRPSPARRGPSRGSALPILGVPVDERDVVRAAFTWNLAVEIVRQGARAAVVAPATDGASALWPEESPGALGADVALVPATNLGQLYRAAQEVAVDRGSGSRAGQDGGIVFVRIPPLWLRQPRGATELLRWVLLFTSSEGRDLLETYGISKLLSAARPDVRIGVTIHGARRAGEAEATFSRLADTASRRLGLSLTSYGLLVDDLQVYRAIVAQRPIGRVHPQSPAARSMGDVAHLLLEDAREEMKATRGESQVSRNA